MRIVLLASLCLALWILGSASSCAPGVDGEAPPADAGPRLPPKGPKAFVISRFGESGAFGLIQLADRSVWPRLGPVSNDAVARYFDGHVYVINRLTHDNIQVMRTSDWSLQGQYSVGPRSNPQDLVVVKPEKAYISRLASRALLVVKPLNGEVLKEIDLGELSEVGDQSCQRHDDCSSKRCIQSRCARDGIPELARMHLYKDKLFVLVQRLDRNKQFEPRDKGMLAVIDVQTDALLTALPTLASNPTGLLARGGILYVTQVGRWRNGPEVVLDGLIEAFDLDGLKSKGAVITERELGGNISAFALSKAGHGYAIISNDAWQTQLLRFDLKSKQKKLIAQSPCVTKGACFGFFQLSISPNDRLFLVDRQQGSPGVRVFSGETGEELTKAPLDMGLPPDSLVFIP